MKSNNMKSYAAVIALVAGGIISVPAQSTDLDQLKSDMQTMQQNMTEMQKKIDELEKEKAEAAEAQSAMEKSSPSIQEMEKVAAGQDIGTNSPVASRESFNDQQTPAQRPGELTQDPKYRGFVPVPNTPVLVKFNAKPRVDFTSDSQNSGNPDRFVTAQIPVRGQLGYGGSEQFNVNTRASQLSLDVRAPEMPGNLRFYYQNDFFGSGSGMQYRVQQLYGQFYNVTAGFTYSVFEDPDAWPDTVDYEGPNAQIWARRPLVKYMLPLNDRWQMNFGIEQPSSETDSHSQTVTDSSNISQNNSAPDGTMNVRWEDSKWGHVQASSVVRDIGSTGPGLGNQSVFGWGVNLCSSINVFDGDSFQEEVTYGQGIFRYFNDDFVNNDAAYDNSGNLKALPVFGAMGAYTHKWCDDFRSTASFGYVNIDNEASQGPDAYNQTYYSSMNVIWQLRKHLSVGVEGLYGRKEVQSGEWGDVFRVQMALMYSIF